MSEEHETLSGNAAAMRDALDKLMHGEYKDRCEVTEIAYAGLMAQERNCDMFHTWKDAWDYWREFGKHPTRVERPSSATILFLEWLFAPAAEKGETA